MQVAYGGFLFAYALHLQAGLGFSPLRAGLTFAPFAAAFAIASVCRSHLPRRLQHWVAPPVALPLLAIAYAAVGTIGRNGGWPPAAECAALVLAGAAFGASFSPCVAITVASTPREYAADASAIVGSVVQLGFVGGLATLGTWFAHHRGHEQRSSGLAFAAVALAAGVLAAIAAAPMATEARHRPIRFLSRTR
jgi:hypothetical protein